MGGLRRIGLVPIELGEVSYSLRSGLVVTELAVSAEAGSAVAALVNVPGRPVAAHLARGYLRCDLLALLRGKIRPTEVNARGLSVTLASSTLPAAIAATEPCESALVISGDDLRRAREFLAAGSAWPRVVLERGDVQLFDVSAAAPRLARRWVIDATGEPASDAAGYVLRLYRTGADHSAECLAELRCRPDGLAARLDWLDLETLALRLPSTMTRAVGDLGPRGRLRVDHLVIDTEQTTAGGDAIDPLQMVKSAEMRLADLSLSLAVEDEQANVPPAERFVQVTGAEALLTIREHRLALDGSGRVNDSAARFSLAANLTQAFQRQPDGATGQSVAGGEPASYARWLERAELRIDALEFPTAEDYPAFVSSARLPFAMQCFFRDYRPHGPANMHFLVQRTEQSAVGLTLSGEVEALGVRARYFRFPYDVDDVRGKFRFSPGGIVIEDLRGRHGSGWVLVSGRVNHTRRHAGLTLDVQGRSIALDNALYTALPPDYKRLWDSAAPRGLCDVRATIQRAESTPGVGGMPTRVRVETQLLSGSLSAGEGQRLEYADGRITVESGLVTVHDLHGYLDGAGVGLAGTIDARRPGEPPETDLHVEAADVLIERTFTAAPQAVLAGAANAAAPDALPSATADMPAAVQSGLTFRGRGDVWGRIHGAGLFDSRDARHVVRIKDGVLGSFAPARPWQDTQGWIASRGGAQEIVSFSARSDAAWLEAAGTLPAGFDQGQPVKLDLRAGDAEMEQLIRQVVPGCWADVGEALGLAGPGRISAHFRPVDTGGDENRQALDITLTAARMKPRPLPLELDEVLAHLTLRADEFDLHLAEATYRGRGKIRVSGHGGGRAGDKWSDLSVTAQELAFCPNLIEAMPGKFSDLLRRMAPKGRVHATLDHVRMTSTDGREWDIAGQLSLEEADLHLGLALTGFSGELRGDCTVRADGEVAVAGEFGIAAGQLAGRDIERCEGKITHKPGEPWIELRDLRGRICAGEVLGLARVDPASGAYEISLTLHDLSIEQFVARTASAQPTPRQGRLDGRVFLRGLSGDNASRRGGGELRVRGASFPRTPVLASVAEASRRANRSIDDALDLAELRFVWEGSELKLTRVEIQSRDLRLIGEGSWNMPDDSINLTLLGAHPKHWPRIAVLSDLLESAGQELMQYRVTGTVANPHVSTEPLHNLTAPLKALLGEDGQGG